jgi:hypothetical protein
MPESRPRNGNSAKDGLAALGLAVVAVGCCAGLPLLAALAGSVALGTLLGVGAGILAAVGLVGAVMLKVRARTRGQRSTHGRA